MALTVKPVGTARQAYRIDTDTRSIQIRTSSQRRYLVVSLRGAYVVKRTDNRNTAEQARKGDPDRIVVDRYIVDGGVPL